MNAKESPSASTSFSVSYLLQRPFFFFSFLPWSACRLSLFLFSTYFSFSSDVLPFFSPSVEPKTFFSSAQHISFFFSFLFCFQLTFFFILVQRLLLLLLFSLPFTFLQRLTSSFLQTCCSFKFSLLFFQTKTVLSPKYFFSFSAQKFFSFSAQMFFSFFSDPNVFASVQPLFSASFFSALFFSGSSLFFLFQHLLFFFSLAPFIQGPIFSLAASHLFYLNKSLFSSNLK